VRESAVSGKVECVGGFEKNFEKEKTNYNRKCSDKDKNKGMGGKMSFRL